MKISEDINEIIENLYSKGDEEASEIGTISLVELGDWEDDGKYQYQEKIVRIKDEFYSWTITRSGSYFTEYYYERPTEIYRVEEKTKTITYWEDVA